MNQVNPRTYTYGTDSDIARYAEISSFIASLSQDGPSPQLVLATYQDLIIPLKNPMTADNVLVSCEKLQTDLRLSVMMYYGALLRIAENAAKANIAAPTMATKDRLVRAIRLCIVDTFIDLSNRKLVYRRDTGLAEGLASIADPKLIQVYHTPFQYMRITKAAMECCNNDVRQALTHWVTTPKYEIDI